VDYILVDRMNYHYADFVYKKYGLEEYMTEEYFTQVSQQIRSDPLLFIRQSVGWHFEHGV
ncbi:MAG: hypothetical protein PHU09_10345, partial [Aminobacterium sp.]|nr:hypothetical protein [Aminobacterium sp.]